jgi:vacuolar-type H+-ATPase subunit E/Vma4
MALAELLRALEQDADTRIAALLADARTEADRVAAEAAAELTRRRATEVGAREASHRAAAARAIESARRQAASRLLEARANALDRIRSRAERLLAHRDVDAELADLLRGDLLLALEYLGPVPAVVEASPPLIEALRAAPPAGTRVTFTATNGRPGLVVRAENGSVTVDATLSGRLARAWPRLAIDLARELEGRP